MTEDLMSIGELARRSGLTPKALRLYDESGLLVPASVDPFTGYRSYRLDQVGRARLIASLRGVGMDLSRIAVVCALPATGASQELRSWWHQQRADAASRDELVLDLLSSFDETPKEIVMSTTSLTHRSAASTRRLDRAVLQDQALARELPGGRLLLAVADGFGEGPSPSCDVVAALVDRLEKEFLGGNEPLEALRLAWTDASSAVPEDGGDRSGSTLTAAIIEGDELTIAHIGDTRAILVRDGVPLSLTQDHTHVASLVAAGRLSADEVAGHPQRAVLNRAFAPGSPRKPDIALRTLQAGDRLVLLSDGVHAVLEAAALAELIGGNGSPEEIAAAVEEAVVAAGGEDDVAIAVADIG